jgi:hypothetical protein
MDLTKFSTDDLVALQAGDLSKLSTPGLKILQSQALQPEAPKAPAPATDRDRLLSSAPMRLAKGGFDPIQGGAQLLSRIPGADTVNRAADATGGFLNRQVFNRLGLPGDFAGEVLGIRGATPAQIDQDITSSEREYQQARAATAPTTLSSLVTGEKDPGTDWLRLAGNVASPANAGIARLVPGAGSTLLRRSAVGAGGGTLAALAQPVVGAEGGNYASSKAVQVGAGAAGGAVLAPLMGAVGDRVTQWAANRAATKAASRPPSSAEVEAIVQRVATDTGQRLEDLGPQQVDALRQQVARAMVASGGRRDPASLARAADFEAEGIQPTLGQITRDSRQYAQEMNLRQLPGTGDPLLERFSAQGRQLQDKVGQFGRGAQQDYRAGNALMGPLKAYDAKLSSDVSGAYRAAREAAGHDVELPMQGLAQDVGRIMDDFEGSIPPNIVARLRKFGILPGQEESSARRLFTPEEADQLIKLVNSSGNAADKGTGNALKQLRAAIGKSLDEPFEASPTLTRDSADAFNKARGMAADRFKLHDTVDAIAEVASGKANPDNFVDRFVVNGQTDQTIRLAGILKSQSPEAYQQARAQIGAKLGRSAFGENVTGDKAFSVERYAKALNDLGDDKLAAFFTPQEIDQLHRLGRLGAYMNQAPAKSPVNTSGNWGAITDLAARIPGVGQAIGLYKQGSTAISTRRGVRDALAAQVPQEAAEVSPAAVRRLSDLLGTSGVVAGSVLAPQ